MEVPISHLDTWADFKDYAYSWIYIKHSGQRGDYWFRGQSKSEWQLVSSFDREFFEVPNWPLIEEELLNEFKRSCEDHDNFEQLFSSTERHAALAQHHGVPTRLLDWSESPYVAAYFAFQGAISQLLTNERSTDDRVAIWIANRHSSIWKPENHVRMFSVAAWNNARLFRQSGWFSFNNSEVRSIDDFVRNREGEDTPLACITIPMTEAYPAILDLDLMGITADSIYGGLEGKAQTAKNRVLLRLLGQRYN